MTQTSRLDDSIVPLGPTVALIGGPMTAEDGSRLDSRQVVIGDPRCGIMRTALAGSMLWWLTVISLVEPLLRVAGADAFALIIGPRSVLQLQSDGSLRRTRLGAVIPGGVSRVEIQRSGIGEALDPRYELAGEMKTAWDGSSMGEIGLAYSEPRRSWRVLDGNEWYLNVAGPALNPAVIVDTTDSVLYDESFKALATRRLFDERLVLVLPHTHAAQTHLKAYGQTQGPRAVPPVDTQATPWDPDAPPDPMKYTTVVPIEARFGVTGLLQRYAWEDPSQIEAARALLQARFDLRIGIWDLVRNPVLRRTLLDAAPTPVVPERSAEIPAGAAVRARRAVSDRVEGRKNEDLSLRRIESLCKPVLRRGRWRQRRGRVFSYEDLGEPLRRPWTGGLEPVAALTLIIGKRQTSVIVRSVFASATACERLTDQCARFAELAQPGICKLDAAPPVLWREVGGWADEVDWPARAETLVERTQGWVNALAPYLDECRHSHREKISKSELAGAELASDASTHLDA